MCRKIKENLLFFSNNKRMGHSVDRSGYRGEYPRTHGFTLVELAIVMTIIGLLIGGILKGQEMLQNARNTATIAQVKSYEAASLSFVDIYASSPGDTQGASSHIAGCNIGCDPWIGATGANNRIVGDPNWSANWNPQGGATVGNAATTGFTQETYLFWTHLLLANLIGGVTADGIRTVTTYKFGVTHPSAPIGGGFVAGYADGSSGAPGNSGQNCGNGNNNGNNGNCRGVGSGGDGFIIVLLPSPTASPATVTTSSQTLQPRQAAAIDRKLDDGRPDEGGIMAFGAPSCFSGGGGGAIEMYDETVSTKDCGLFFSVAY